MPEISVGMVFAFLIAIILIGSILAFGLGPLSNLFQFGSQAQLYNEVKKIEQEAEWLFDQSWGSQQEYQIAVPSGSKLCFVNPDFPNASSWGATSWKNWPPEDIMINLTRDPYSEYYRSNVWIWRGTGKWEGYKTPNLKPDKNFCVEGSRTLWLINKGEYVEISAE